MKPIIQAFTFSLLAAAALQATAEDEVKVVKGQISDYYIPVVKEHLIRGTVSDANGKVLEGATVMFFASPAHCNTDAKCNAQADGGSRANAFCSPARQRRLIRF